MGYKDVTDDCSKSCFCPCLSIYQHAVELEHKYDRIYDGDSDNHFEFEDVEISSLPSTVKIQPWKSPPKNVYNYS